MRATIGALVLLLTLPALAQDQSNAEKLEVLRRIYAATVKVSVVFNDRQSGHGTGVSVMHCGNRGYKLVLTNSHVIAGTLEETRTLAVAPSVRVKPHGESDDVWLDAYVLYHELNKETYRDIAYLVVRDPDDLLGTATLPPARNVAAGTPVWACGNPHELEFFMDHGEILGADAIKNPPPGISGLILHNALIERGNSGGGVFNAKGELIGINTWVFDGKVSGAQDIFEFYRDHRLGTESFDAQAGRPHALWAEYSTQGQGVRAMAFGSYSCTKGGATMTAAGVPGNPEGCINRALNFGAILFTIAGSTKPFDFAYPGSDGRPVRYRDVVLCDEMRDVGRFRFDMNDNFPLDNTGRVTIVYLVTGPARMDIGVEVAEPTDAECETRKRWLSFTDAEGKTTSLPRGAKVVSVQPGSEAAACGLRVGDVIMTWPGPPIELNSAADMVIRDRVDARTLGEHQRWSRGELIYQQHGVDFGIVRDGEWVSLRLLFGDYK